jgi:hypothetical protein
LARLLQALHNSEAAFAYSQLPDLAMRLAWDGRCLGIVAAHVGHYVDTMALIRRQAIEIAGGYGVLAVEQGGRITICGAALPSCI